MIRHEFTTLGKTIRQLRKGRRLSQEAFAESCGIHRTYICDVERGVRNVTLRSLMRIARALGTTVSELTQNLEKDARPPEKRQNLLYMNSTKLLIGVAVLFLAALPAQAQSVLEDLIFESATASSIIENQVVSDASAAGSLPIWAVSIAGNNSVFSQGTIASGAGQIRGDASSVTDNAKEIPQSTNATAVAGFITTNPGSTRNRISTLAAQPGKTTAPDNISLSQSDQSKESREKQKR